MTREEIKNRIIEIIADKIGVSICEVQENMRFKEDLGTDSLDDIELCVEFERVFRIKISDEDMSMVCTVDEAIDGICQKVGVSICKKQQPNVDLEKEIGRWMDKLDDKYCMLVKNYSIQDLKNTARYFYELGLNARKEE